MKRLSIIPLLALVIASCGGGSNNQTQTQGGDNATAAEPTTSTATTAEPDSPKAPCILFATGDINRDGNRDSVAISAREWQDELNEKHLIAKSLQIFFGDKGGRYTLHKDIDASKLGARYGFENDEEFASYFHWDTLAISQNGELIIRYCFGLDGSSTPTYKARYDGNDLRVFYYQNDDEGEAYYSFTCDLTSKKFSTEGEDYVVDADECHVHTRTGNVQYSQLPKLADIFGKGLEIDWESEQRTANNLSYKDLYSDIKYTNVEETRLIRNNCDLQEVWKWIDRKPDDAKGKKELSFKGVVAEYSISVNDGHCTRTRSLHSYEKGGGEYIVLDIYKLACETQSGTYNLSEHEITEYSYKDGKLSKIRLQDELKPYSKEGYDSHFDEENAYGHMGHKIVFMTSGGDETVFEWYNDKFVLRSGSTQSASADNNVAKEVFKKQFPSTKNIDWYEDTPLKCYGYPESECEGCGASEGLACYPLNGGGYLITFVSEFSGPGCASEYRFWTSKYKDGNLTDVNDVLPLPKLEEMLNPDKAKNYKSDIAKFKSELFDKNPNDFICYEFMPPETLTVRLHPWDCDNAHYNMDKVMLDPYNDDPVPTYTWDGERFVKKQ